METSTDPYRSCAVLLDNFILFKSCSNLALNGKVWLGYWLNFVWSTLVFIVEFGLGLGLVWLSLVWFG